MSLQIRSKENMFCRIAEHISIGFDNDIAILRKTSWVKISKKAVTLPLYVVWDPHLQKTQLIAFYVLLFSNKEIFVRDTYFITGNIFRLFIL